MTTYMPAIHTVYSAMDTDTDTDTTTKQLLALLLQRDTATSAVAVAAAAAAVMPPSPDPTATQFYQKSAYQPALAPSTGYTARQHPLLSKGGVEDMMVDAEEEELGMDGMALLGPAGLLSSAVAGRRRLPIFVRLTEREARRRERIALARALLAELGAHRRDIAAFKRLHTRRLAQLEHERVAPMEAAVAAVMAMAAVQTPVSKRVCSNNGGGVHLSDAMLPSQPQQQISGRTARAAAAARQRARLSPSELSVNRSMSERAVSVLQAADRLESRGDDLIYAARAIIDQELGRVASDRHRAALVSRRYDSDADSDCGSDASCLSDLGSGASSDDGRSVQSYDSAMSADYSSHYRYHYNGTPTTTNYAEIHLRVAQLDHLASAVERLRHVAADFMCAYPA